MGNGHLGAQGDLVDRAGDTMPMVPRYTQHAYITDRHEDGRQPQTHNGVNGAVERRGGSPSAVPEIRGAAAQPWAIPDRYRGYWETERVLREIDAKMRNKFFFLFFFKLYLYALLLKIK